PAYPVGTVVSAMTGWQDYAVVAPDELPVPLRVKAPDMDLVDFEGLFGGNSLTAYFGLLRIGEPRAGETLLVSGAAGSTGSIAAQIGKIMGCRVIGIAGGTDKCRWLVETLGLDAAIDYKHEDVEARLSVLCPDGVHIFYDNVGGATLDAAIAHMAPHGRVVLCGQIGSYDEGDSLSPGPKDMMRVIYWRLKLQGFLSFDYDDERPAAEADLARWAADGRLIHHAEMIEGFDRLPATYLRLFDGSHRGTMLLRPD
ncbi:MAG: NADP-dependent oxidoreductase, partial [Rhizorhabdus sp.]